MRRHRIELEHAFRERDDALLERNRWRGEAQMLKRQLDRWLAESTPVSDDAALAEWIGDLEDLIRWLAQTFRWFDPTTEEWRYNDPAFTMETLPDGRLERTADSERLWRCFQRVVHRLNPDDPGRSWLGTGAP